MATPDSKAGRRWSTWRRHARGAQGYAGWNNNTAFGNWGGDGECSYYNSPNGDSVMVGNC
jgi:hypothetical protein